MASPISSVVATRASLDPRVTNLVSSLRVSETVILGYLSYAVIASLVFPLPFREWVLAIGLNLLAGGLLLLIGIVAEHSELVSIIRNWLPAVLILVAYRESGLFFVPDPVHHLDYVFVKLDRILLQNSPARSLFSFSAPWLQRYLEFSYMLCYPLVPLGLAALYLVPTVSAGRERWRSTIPEDRRESLRQAERVIDRFWTTVLLATLTCYVLYPLFPLTPPRLLFNDVSGPTVAPLLRHLNFWILDQYSVQACIFPSGHVAAVTATALAVRKHLSRIGFLFIVAAASVGLATVYGRYHYALDAFAGVVVGIGAYQIACRLFDEKDALG
jgi:membrane-associated phospholipid phosphatase